MTRRPGTSTRPAAKASSTSRSKLMQTTTSVSRAYPRAPPPAHRCSCPSGGAYTWPCRVIRIAAPSCACSKWCPEIYLDVPPTIRSMRPIIMYPRHHLLRSLACAAALATLGSVAHADEREAPPIREVQEIPLPGVQGRLDHFTIDAKRQRVIFSGLGNHTVQVVDVFAGRMIHQIDGLAQPQGTLYLAEWDKPFAANWP